MRTRPNPSEQRAPIAAYGAPSPRFVVGAFLAALAAVSCGEGMVECEACGALAESAQDPSGDDAAGGDPTQTTTPTGQALLVDVTRNVHPISPFIYGTNEARFSGADARLALSRAGGNRWSAYNWENNASNAGIDFNHQNDSHLGGGNTPGEAVRSRVAAAHQAGAAALVTVPLLDVVAADKNGDGDVGNSANYMATRFVQSRAAKGAPFAAPSTGDGAVYQDEFVAWLESQFPAARNEPVKTIFYSLDNEPDLWDSTHVRIHPAKPTYAELLAKTVAFAGAIKDVAPEAMIFGPVNYGWSGFVSLQAAPDAGGRDFLDFYLGELKEVGDTQGRRLVDVVDVHWYPEATGGGTRIIEHVSTPDCVAARLQAPRSLWDSSYLEKSWITGYLGQPLALLPRLRAKIAAHDPAVRIAITEYYYGAGEHISGGLAQADVLGVFGREDVFAAALWRYGNPHHFIEGAFALYRNYDGAGGKFGDTSVEAKSNDVAAFSVFASTDTAAPGKVWVLVINKTSTAQAPTLLVSGAGVLTTASVYRLTATAPTPVADGVVAVSGGDSLVAQLPAMSASLYVLAP